MRAYLATLYNGIMTENNKADFAEVDTNSSAFAEVQSAVKIACAYIKKQEYDDSGDDTMTAIFDQYITKEAREAAEKKGRSEGRAEGIKQTFDVISDVIRLLKENVPVVEIADKCEITVQEVEKLRIVL